MSKNIYVGKSIEELEEIIRKNRTDMEVTRWLGFGGLMLNSFTLNDIVGNTIIWGSIINMLVKGGRGIEYISNAESYYKNSKEYIALEQSYKTVLKELLKLFKSLGFDNEAKIYAGYNYMLKEGYLSCDRMFSKIEDIERCIYLFGSNVITGKCNSRHMSAMLTDLLKMDGYNAYTLSRLYNRRMGDIIEGPMHPELEKSQFANFLLDSINYWYNKYDSYEFDTNYAVTSITDGNHSYIMDVYLDRFISITESLKMVLGPLNYSMFCHEYLNGGRSGKIRNILKPTQNDLLSSRLSDRSEALNICSDCIDVFDKFYREHNELYREVVGMRKVLIRECNKSSSFNRMVK